MSPGEVLVIEDDESTAALILSVLRRSGLTCVHKVDGRSGMRTLHEARPRLIVLDVGLPDLDGWSVLERIRDVSDVPVLMLTGHTSSGDVVRGLQTGADDYLFKHFDNGELLARVQALLRRVRPTDSAAEPMTIVRDGPLVI